MKQNKILIVDDDNLLREMLILPLRQEGFIVDEAKCGQDAIESIQNNNYDLYVLDVSLPDINGYFLCELIRQESLSPVIFISSDNNESNIIRGFHSGGDEFLIKPLRAKEFVIRCRSLLNRCQYQNYSKIVEIGNLKFNRSTDTVTIGTQKINLTQTEIKILKILIEHAGEIVSSKYLLNNVWGWNESMGTAVVSTNMNRLRTKLGKEKIVTIKGQGYRLEC